jgi:hypothetical protein
VVLVPAGEAFTPRQREAIERAVRQAMQQTDLRFSVYVGALEGDPRERAEVLLAGVGADAPRTVLIAVDPGARALEIVTGVLAKRLLDDYACGLGALAMTTQFAAGDLAGGIVSGLRTLGEHARSPRILHVEQG